MVMVHLLRVIVSAVVAPLALEPIKQAGLSQIDNNLSSRVAAEAMPTYHHVVPRF